jgi:3-hydroxyacyl-CoA dehydrogenase
MSDPQPTFAPHAQPAAPRDGLRHLAGLRRLARVNPAPLPERAVLLGASGAAVALAGRLADRGVSVTVIEGDADAAARLTAHLARLGGRSVEVVGRGRIGVAETAAPVAGAGLVIDTSGSPGQGGWLAKAMQIAPDDTLIAALTETASGLPHPARVVALRLVAPGVGLIEILSHPDSPPVTSIRTARLAAGLGCAPIRVPTGAEGAGARLLARFEAVAEALVFAGAAPWDLDAAAEAAGFAQGPCALMDRLGLDSALPRRARLAAAGAALPDPGVIVRMVAEGRLGRRASVGWFRYPGGGGQVTDPLIEDLVREEAWFARHPPRPFDDATLARHLLAALIDEAARLMDEGAVTGPGDIDLAAALALGFPPRLGGPVWLADRWGAGAALAAVDSLRADLSGLPDVPHPAQALHRAARSGLTLAEGAGSG